MGYYDDVLEHHGILGQKWGVRRFENKNGHLTSAGLKRYEDGRKVTEKEKHAFSAKAAGYKALGALHTVNAKAPINTKAGRTLAKAAAKEANKVAEKAQKEADAKKAEKDANKKTLTPEQKKKIIIAGAAIAGTALAAYGGYKLYQLNKQATEGLSKEYSKKADQKINESLDYFKLQSAHLKNATDYQNSNLPGNIKKAGYSDALNRAAQYRQKSNAALEEGRKLEKLAKYKKYSVKEKVNYLKSQKSTANKSVSETSTPTKPAQTTQTGSQTKPKYSPRTVVAPPSVNNQKSSLQWQQAQRTAKIHGQEKFVDASKANDDLVQELLKKNTLKL